MDFNGVKEIIESINSSNIAYFEFKTADGHIKMDKSLTRDLSKAHFNKVVEKVESEVELNKTNEVVSNTATAPATVTTSVEENKSEIIEDESDLYIVKSPMVGTFYSSPSPDKDAFVKVGDHVSKNSNLCIIEAMKLMNEIESEVDGTIKEVLIKDGEMVEYGQPLFKIKED